MEYMLFICTDSTAPTTAPSAHTIEEWVAETTKGGTRRRGDRLRPANDATTVKMRGGQLSVTAGPFAETAEWIAGYDVIECSDLDAAIEIAARHPMAQRGQYEPVDPDPDAHGDMDDRLRLIFTCCHPALSMDDRVALTLRTVAGFTPAQIAGAFLVTEPAMDKRLVRARAKIKHAGIPYRVPPPRLMPERRDGVLAVLYLLFTEGYSATGGGALTRVPLLHEAIRLTRLLVELMPDDGEVRALLALMLLQHARTAARTDAVGNVVTLGEQDRSLWDRDAITEALTILRPLLPRAGRYRLQAHIAACHLETSDAASTNVARIAELYDALAFIEPSPVVELNSTVAVAMSQGPEVGLRLIEEIVTSRGMGDYYLLPATRADLLRRMGRSTESATEYEKALQLAPSEAEKRCLGKRLAEMRR